MIKINENMKNAINYSLDGRKNGRHWETLVGFTCKDLIIHLEKQFKKEITWETYGSYWHIDHIIPLTCFKFESTEDTEFKMAWCLDNLQPLEKTRNLKKHNNLNVSRVLSDKKAMAILLKLLLHKDFSLREYNSGYIKDNLERILDKNGFRYVQCC